MISGSQCCFPILLQCSTCAISIHLQVLGNALLQSGTSGSRSPWWSFGEGFAQRWDVVIPLAYDKKDNFRNVLECTYFCAFPAVFTQEFSKDDLFLTHRWEMCGTKGILNPFLPHCTLGSTWLLEYLRYSSFWAIFKPGNLLDQFSCFSDPCEHEICLFWHTRSACPFPNSPGCAWHSQVGMYFGMTCHFAFSSTCWSEILFVVIFSLQKILCWWKLVGSKLDRNTDACWIPWKLHDRVAQNSGQRTVESGAKKAMGKNYLPTSHP